MGDMKGQLWKVKRKLEKDTGVTIILPARFSFKDHGLIEFDNVLSVFDWSLENCPVTVDFRVCKSPNYQALALLVQYLWK